jgi:REP element-mobilizing transposase RayT
MAKRDYIDFQDRGQPLAYLITFRSYGTWLHGDERGSIDRRNYNRYGTPAMPANSRILVEEQGNLKTGAVLLNSKQRAIVEAAIHEVCQYRNWVLHAVNARMNHVHSVVSARCPPENVMNNFKSYATRRLREAGALAQHVRPWARHGSTPYLWTEEQVARAVDYVVNGQGDEPFV